MARRGSNARGRSHNFSLGIGYGVYEVVVVGGRVRDLRCRDKLSSRPCGLFPSADERS